LGLLAFMQKDLMKQEKIKLLKEKLHLYSGVINLQNIISDKNGISLLSFLSDFPKYKSVGAMSLAGLPVPKSIIIISDNAEAKKECNRIISDWKISEVVVRSEPYGGRIDSISIQGCKINDVWPNVVAFLKQDLLPMVISTGDIFHNTYSMNIKIEPNNNKNIYLEIVGPGFCATDINKRDIINERGTLKESEGKLIFSDSSVVSQKAYNYQVELLLLNQIQKEEKSRGKRFANKKDAKKWVTDFLTEKGALIISSSKYKRIPFEYLKKVWLLLPGIFRAGEYMGYFDTYIVSMSFVQEGENENPYFWDIHPWGGYKSTR
jgi:hypothetical protein